MREGGCWWRCRARPGGGDLRPGAGAGKFARSGVCSFWEDCDVQGGEHGSAAVLFRARARGRSRQSVCLSARMKSEGRSPWRTPVAEATEGSRSDGRPPRRAAPVARGVLAVGRGGHWPASASKEEGLGRMCLGVLRGQLEGEVVRVPGRDCTRLAGLLQIGSVAPDRLAKTPRLGEQ